MSNIKRVETAMKTGPGYLKFYMSQTAFFLEGGYLIDVPVEGFHKFVFTQAVFIKQGQKDPGFDNKYGDSVLLIAGDASAYAGMENTVIPSIKSRM